MSADHYHAGLPPECGREFQEQFDSVTLKVIAATNAIGMGIVKPDIRLVVHADISTSLEIYMQETEPIINVKAGLNADNNYKLIIMVRELINAPKDKGITSDSLGGGVG